MPFETLFSVVSTVEATLHPHCNAIDALQQCFPPGSMTGAPKLRTVQIISEKLECKPRGVYSGCIGYLSVCGASQFNVVIRTVVGDDSKGVLSVGGGGAIVSLSDPESEWEEVLLKIGSVANSIAEVVNYENS
jgi:para-aminobenzoate synthetase